VTSDASGNLATDGGAIFSKLGRLDRRLDKASEGAALAVALQTPFVPLTQRFALSGGWGHFDDKNALAIAAAFRLNPNVQFEGGIGYGVSHSSVAGRAGLTVNW
jgi:hypothetical protein